MERKPTSDLIRDADDAVAFAVQIREAHARRTPPGASQREDDIRNGLRRLRDAMQPLRSALGSFPFEPQTAAAEARRASVRAASDRVQSQRRKLTKMRNRNPNPKKRGSRRA
jgi:hypothetical protein